MSAARAVDQVLRADPAAHPDGDPPFRLGPLVLADVVLAVVYGVCMGVYGVFRPDGPEWRLMAAAAFKVPLLIGLTVAVTFPSLYVFITLFGSRLAVGPLGRLVAAAVAVMLAVLAAFGPIVAFFSVSTTSYPFILLLNVAVFGVGGLFAVAYLYRAVGGRRRVVAVWLGVFALVGPQMGWVLRPFVGSPGLPFAWFRPREGSFVEAVVRAVGQLVGL